MTSINIDPVIWEKAKIEAIKRKITLTKFIELCIRNNT